MPDYNTNGPRGPMDFQNNQKTGQWGGDFSGQLNDILAPYQRMAQQISSPYATMRPDSWLAKNHPQVANVLDNAFLTAGSTPSAQGPEGVGGGISRMMQGLMGGQQFKRQQQIQTAMLPYQMAAGQLQAMDVASQIGERQAMLPFRMAQERRYDAQSDMYYNRMQDADRMKSLTGQDMTDDKGRAWSRIFDPVTGRTRNFNSEMGKFSDELGQGEQPTFQNEEKTKKLNAVGGKLGEIIDMRMSSDPAIREQGRRMGDIYTGLMGAAAGARTGADQTAPHPYADTKTFVQQERQAAYGTLPKPQSASDYQTAHLTDADYWKDPQASYEKYQKQAQGTKQQLDVDLGKFEKSTAPSKGVSFSEYMQNRDQYDKQVPPPVVTTPTANGPSQPKVIQYNADGTRQ